MKGYMISCYFTQKNGYFEKRTFIVQDLDDVMDVLSMVGIDLIEHYASIKLFDSEKEIML